MGKTGRVAEQRLSGGAVNEVVLVDGTVRRRPAAGRAEFVHRLLAHFQQQDWPGAPRFLGHDEQGREMLSYLPGYVAWREPQPDWLRSAECLAATARLLRQCHDLTEGPALAGEQEVVCHNDLAPKNTVYDDDRRPIAFIDWDLAAPGARIHDVAHLCWQYLDLGPAIRDVARAARNLRIICDAYGLDDRATLLDTVYWWQERCWQGIDAAADAGEPAMIALRDAGTCDTVRAAADWLDTHRTALSAELG